MNSIWFLFENSMGTKIIKFWKVSTAKSKLFDESIDGQIFFSCHKCSSVIRMKIGCDPPHPFSFSPTDGEIVPPLCLSMSYHAKFNSNRTAKTCVRAAFQYRVHTSTYSNKIALVSRSHLLSQKSSLPKRDVLLFDHKPGSGFELCGSICFRKSSLDASSHLPLYTSLNLDRYGNPTTATFHRWIGWP